MQLIFNFWPSIANRLPGPREEVLFTPTNKPVFNIVWQQKYQNITACLRCCCTCSSYSLKLQVWYECWDYNPVPDPSGMDLTKVGSILTVAVGLVSRRSPFSISLRNRFMMSFSVSSEKRMEYRYLSIWGQDTNTSWESWEFIQNLFSPFLFLFLTNKAKVTYLIQINQSVTCTEQWEPAMKRN